MRVETNVQVDCLDPSNLGIRLSLATGGKSLFKFRLIVCPSIRKYFDLDKRGSSY